MKSDRAMTLEPLADPMAQPVTEHLPEPPVEVQFGRSAETGDWEGAKL